MQHCCGGFAPMGLSTRCISLFSFLGRKHMYMSLLCSFRGHLLACFPHVHTCSFRRKCSRNLSSVSPFSVPQLAGPATIWIILPTYSFADSLNTHMRGCICSSSSTHVVHHTGDPPACPTSPSNPGHYYKSVCIRLRLRKSSFLPLLVTCVCKFSLNMFSLLYINYA